MPYAAPTHRPHPTAPKARTPRGKTAARGYDGRWQRLRDKYLREHPLCDECDRQGRLELAVMVDHVTPIADGGAVLDEDNLQSLCRQCHADKTGRETAGRGKGVRSSGRSVS